MRHSDFEKSIGYVFKNTSLLETAFTHRSFLNEHTGKESNERLEFLGDAVLELIVTSYLYETFPDRDEGILTSLRSALVRGSNLANIAKNLDIGSYIHMSKGEQATGGKGKPYLLANTMEAVIGAVYLDSGLDSCRKLVFTLIVPTLDEILREALYIDAKTLFQEKSQDLYEITPHYSVHEDKGPDHDKIFTVGAYIGDDCVALGSGKSKQEAQENAARNALTAKNWIEPIGRR